MKEYIKISLAGIAGATIGSIVTYTVMHKKMEAESSNKISEFIEGWNKRQNKPILSDSGDDSNSDDEHIKNIEKERKKASKMAKNILEENNYIPSEHYYDYKNNNRMATLFDLEDAEEMQQELAEKQHPKDEETDPYFMDDEEIDNDRSEIILATLYSDGVLAEDPSNKEIIPDKNSVSPEIISDILSKNDMNGEWFVKNPGMGVIYDISLAEESYVEMMKVYHGY